MLLINYVNVCKLRDYVLDKPTLHTRIFQNILCDPFYKSEALMNLNFVS